jgi:hypothetical protein
MASTLRLFICIMALLAAFKCRHIKCASLNLDEISEKSIITSSSSSVNNDDDIVENYENDDDQQWSQQHQPSQCKCKNGGMCALDDDFCVCSPKFTGRYCEIVLESDHDGSLACGQMQHGEIEYNRCAKCECGQRLLVCVPLWTPACNLEYLEYRQHVSSSLSPSTSKLTPSTQAKKNPKSYVLNSRQNIIDMKGSDLRLLMKLVGIIENATYQSYIDFYTNSLAYHVLHAHLDDGAEQKERDEEEHTQRDANVLVVLYERGRPAGIYFPSSNKNTYDEADKSSATCSPFGSSMISLFSIFVSLFFLISFS